MAIKDKPRVGSLSKRVTFERLTKTIDSRGGRIESWAHVVSVPASVNTSDRVSESFNRNFEVGQERYYQGYTIFIRASIQQRVNPRDYRIKYNGYTLTIHSVIDIEEKGLYYKITAYRKI